MNPASTFNAPGATKSNFVAITADTQFNTTTTTVAAFHEQQRQQQPQSIDSQVAQQQLLTSPPVDGGHGSNLVGVDDERVLQLALQLSLLRLSDSSEIPTNDTNGIVGNIFGDKNTQFTDLTNFGASTSQAATANFNQQQQLIVPQVAQQQFLSFAPSSSQPLYNRPILGSLSLADARESNSNDNLIEDQRALQLAFKLSQLGLTDNLVTPTNDVNDIVDNIVGESNTQLNGLKNYNVSEAAGVLQFDNALNIDPLSLRLLKKSENVTECVSVPSSEHVSEIVGRNGCKIKALRTKTKTFIKTPARNGEPVFIIKGNKEDVKKAKYEILSAAKHFSSIHELRKSGLYGVNNYPQGDGQIKIQVPVADNIIGLIVGKKGVNIKRIQQQTSTHIMSPSLVNKPVFEIIGTPNNANEAKKKIEEIIALSTSLSSSSSSSTNGINDTCSLLTENTNFTDNHSHPSSSSWTPSENRRSLSYWLRLWELPDEHHSVDFDEGLPANASFGE